MVLWSIYVYNYVKDQNLIQVEIIFFNLGWFSISSIF